jgi:hypothetical protein
VRNQYVYAISESFHFKIYDVSDPLNPVTLGYLYFDPGEPAWAWDAAVFTDGIYAYVGFICTDGPNYSAVIDISDINNPSVLSIMGRATNDIYAANDIAYVAGNGRLSLYDLNNPSDPSLQGSFDADDKAWGLHVAGRYVLLTDGLAGLKILDAANPSNILLLDSFNTPDDAWGIDVVNDYIFIADKTSLQILRFGSTNAENITSSPNIHSLSQNYPNPFNGQTLIAYSLPHSDWVNLAVYDLLGRKVQILYEGNQQAGEHYFIWRADVLASGIYFYRLTTYNQVSTGQMTLIK